MHVIIWKVFYVNLPLLCLSIAMFVGGLALLCVDRWRIIRLQKQLKRSGVPNFKEAWRSVALRRRSLIIRGIFIFWMGHWAFYHAFFNSPPGMPPEFRRMMNQKKRESDLAHLPFALVYGGIWVFGVVRTRRSHPATFRKEREN